jgi:hypothetical protein
VPKIIDGLKIAHKLKSTATMFRLSFLRALRAAFANYEPACTTSAKKLKEAKGDEKPDIAALLLDPRLARASGSRISSFIAGSVALSLPLEVRCVLRALSVWVLCVCVRPCFF